MKKVRLWDNPEVRRAILGTACIAGVMGIIMIVMFYQSDQALYRKAHDHQLAVIGSLAAEHPDWADSLARAYAAPAEPEILNAGRAAAERYGWADALPLPADSTFYGHMRLQLLLIGAGVVVLLLSVSLLLMGSYRRMYRTVEDYAELAERIVEGEFHLKAHRPEEGAFAKLSHQFNQMSSRLEWTVERLQAEKEGMKELLSDISHQLKTPLSALKMFNELLQDGASEDEATRTDFLQKSETQIDSMEWLIRQLLLVARMEAGSAVLERKLHPITATLQEVLEKLSPLAAAKGVSLALAPVPPGEAIYEEVRHDPAWLGEAISNLVTNSIEHTPSEGRIDVRLELSPLLVRVIVQDTGAGIAKEELPHIFRRFHKSGRRSPRGGGTGIGLALAKAIVERHEGWIQAASTKGRGTTMTVTIPRTVE